MQTYNGSKSGTSSGYTTLFRGYDTEGGRWNIIDPKWRELPSESPYCGMGNNPVNMVDPWGDLVKILFNRESQTMYILNVDHYKKDLPMKYVSATDYKLVGIRDKEGNLTHNQVLVVNNTFTGGMLENGKVVRDPDKPEQTPLSNGSYDILDNNADINPKHKGWFRLDKQDGNEYNDKDDGTGRSGFRFHLGGLSWGCVTVSKTQDNAQAIWNVVTAILNSTSTTEVPENRGLQYLNPFSKLIRYGTMDVQGEDKIPYKLKEE